MSDVEVTTWSATDASNTAAAPDGAPNNFARTSTKNIFRAIMGGVKRFRDRITPTLSSAGTAPAFTLTYTGAPPAYVQGHVFAFKAHDATGGNMTLDVNTLGAKKVYDVTGTTQITTGAFIANTRMVVSYDTALDGAAGGFVWLNSSPAASATTPGVVELATNAEAQTGTDTARATTPAGVLAARAEGIYNRGYIYGLTLSNNGSDATNDIDIAAGMAADSATPYRMMELAASITKRLDAAWAVGTNQGGLDTGAIANTTYHIWLIRRSDTGVVDALFSASATSPTMPANYDQKRRIGSILRVSGAIVAFSQVGDEFLRLASILDVSANNPGTSAVTRTLSVPTGVKVWAMVNASVANLDVAGDCNLYLSELDKNDEAPSATVAPLSSSGRAVNAGGNAAYKGTGLMFIRTNTSAQIRSRVSFSDADVTVYIATLSWIDRRGRDA